MVFDRPYQVDWIGEQCPRCGAKNVVVEHYKKPRIIEVVCYACERQVAPELAKQILERLYANPK